MDSNNLRFRFSPHNRIAAFAAFLIAALGVAIAPARSIRAASPTPAHLAPLPAAKPAARANTIPNARPSASVSKPAAAATVARHEPAHTDAHTIISYLSDVISWYRHLAVEAQLVREPEEALFYANDAQTAGEILKLGFIYARAQNEWNERAQAATPTAAGVPDGVNSGLDELKQKAAQATADLAAAQLRLRQLQESFARASARKRATLDAQITALQSEVELAQARADALGAMVEFAASSSKAVAKGTGVAAQIDELEHSLPRTESGANQSAPKVAAPPPPGGIVGMLSDLFDLRNETQTLDNTISLTNALLRRVNAMREPLIALLQSVDQRGISLAHQPKAANLSDFRQRRKDYEDLIDAHKLASATLLPLSKQQVLLGLYLENLTRWRGSVDRRADQEFRSLIVRLIGLLSIFAIIAAGAYLWRYFTIRYVADLRRRHQLLGARRLVIWIVVVFVVLLNFANQIGAFATIMGFAAAGIAVALQNVILSVAGYFFLIGRFGIRVGDRVQIGSVTGDVISIGLVKLTLMELAGSNLQPTGRVVVYSNAVVFQPSGNFYKQAPGISFVWNEVRLTLAPDCDYRLAEKRLVDAVDDVFSRYRDKVQSEFRHLEADLHVLLDTPRPTSRMTLTSSGLEIVIRYPAGVRTSYQVADEVTRRVLDAIRRDPSFKLVAPGVPNIQPIEVSTLEQAVVPASGDNGAGAVKTIAAAAERPDDADPNAAVPPSAPAAKEELGTKR